MPAKPFHESTYPALEFLSKEASARFNELLIALYARSSKMDWHDDGEPGVQGTIGTWSLGSPCVMSFRAKDRPRDGIKVKKDEKGKVLRLLLR
jgi:alkylated DNA repair dioxygenase AlkB